MTDGIQEIASETATGVGTAINTVASQGILGALLVLSVVANVALVMALVRCYRRHTHHLGGPTA